VTLLEPVQTGNRAGSDASVMASAAGVVEEIISLCTGLCSGAAASNVSRTFQVRTPSGRSKLQR